MIWLFPGSTAGKPTVQSAMLPQAQALTGGMQTCHCFITGSIPGLDRPGSCSSVFHSMGESGIGGELIHVRTIASSQIFGIMSRYDR